MQGTACAQCDPTKSVTQIRVSHVEIIHGTQRQKTRADNRNLDVGRRW